MLFETRSIDTVLLKVPIESEPTNGPQFTVKETLTAYQILQSEAINQLQLNVIELKYAV